MYRMYLKNKKGEYYYGIFFSDLGRAAVTAIEIRDRIPFIMITNAEDESVFESENGDIVHPDDPSLAGLPPLGIVSSLITSDIGELSAMIGQRNAMDSDTEDFSNMEAALIASAIEHGIDLYGCGWSLPE